MGNTLQAEIRLDHEISGRQEAIVAGTPLRGKVIVQVKKGVEKCNSVLLEVSGKETTLAYQYYDQDIAHRYSQHDADRKLVHDRNSFFRVDLKLQKSGEKLDAQTYVFPFEVELPTSLPASCSYKPKDKGDEDGFAIEYHLKIKIRTRSRVAKFANRRTFLVDSAPIIVSSPSPTIPTSITTETETETIPGSKSTTQPDQKKTAVPCLIQPKAFNAEKFGLVGKGNFILGARVEDTRVGRGQTLWLSLVCRNHSTCDIDKIVIRLIEEYQWTAKKVGGGEDSTTLIEKSERKLPPSVVEWKAKSHRSEDIEALNSEQAKENTNWEIYRDLISNDDKLALDIPWKARDSFTGVKVKVSHYVEIQVKTLLSSSVHTPPTIQVPIRIGNAMTPQLDSDMNAEGGGGQKKSFRISQLELPQSVRKSLAVASKENMILGRRAGLLDTQDSSFRMDNFRLRQSFRQDSIRMEESFSSLTSQDSFRLSQHSTGSSTRSVSSTGGSDKDKDVPPTLSTLLEEMAVSVDDHDLLEHKLLQTKSEWPTLLKDLTPDEFGSVIAHVNMEFAQPKVGVLLARHIGEGFTCAHCVSAVKSTTEVFRPNMVEGLLPFCSDLATEHEMIKEHLSDFEQIIVSMWNVQDEEKDTVINQRTSPKAVNPNETTTMDTNGSGHGGSDHQGQKRRSTLATAPLIAPSLDDICMGMDDHKGTVDCIDVVKWSLVEFTNTEYGPAVYKKIKKKLKGRRFLTHPKRKSSANHPDHWREATQRERIEYVGKCFDNEKWIQKRAEEEAAKIVSSSDDDDGKAQAVENAAADDEWFNTIEEDRKAWEKDMKGSEWDRAVTVTSFDGDDLGLDSDDDDEGGPSKMDVCFDMRDHPGYAAFENEVRALLKKFGNTPWGPPVYKALKKRLKGRRFFYGSMKGQWRELTQQERIDHFGTRFEAEKKKMKERQQRESAAQKLADGTTAAASATSSSIGQPSGETPVEKGKGGKMTQPSSKLPEQPHGQDGQKTSSNGVEAADAKSTKGTSRGKSPTPVEGVAATKKGPSSKKTLNREKTPPTGNNTQSPPSPTPKRTLSREKTPPPPNTQSPPSPIPKRTREKTPPRDNTQSPPSPSASKRISTLYSPRRKEKKSMKHPQEFDVCFGDDEHPGTVSFEKTVKESVPEFINDEWSTPIYKSIKNKLVGRRYFIRPDPALPWREATQEERLERFKDRFDAEQLKCKIGGLFGRSP